MTLYCIGYSLASLRISWEKNGTLLREALKSLSIS